MAIHRGFLLHPTYCLRRGRPVVQLFGRLESGEPFLCEDDRFRPYLFLPAAHRAHIPRGHGFEIEESPLRDLRGRAVVRVWAPAPAAVALLRQALEGRGAEPLEADIRFPYRYLIDHGIRAGIEIEGDAEARGGLWRFRNPRLGPARASVALRVLSVDLETTPDASRVLSAALVGSDSDEVHLVSRDPVAQAQHHADERSLIETVNQRIRELDPDVLVGWNVVDFDLRVWTARCHALGVEASWGRIDGPIRFQRDPGFSRQTRAQIPGRIVLDGIALVRDALRLEDYRLDTVARALLGRGKRIDAEVPDAAREIQRLYREQPEELVAYNREDARLVLEILDQEGLLALAVERSTLSGMQLDRVGASIASFDRLYLPELRRRGRVAPSVERERPATPIQGGALLDPEPGLFRNVAVYDFRSLYPSLIRTFQLDPLAHAEAGESDDLEAPNGARFSRREAILPGVIERFLENRRRARERGDRHADQALKIMMNALFGVLAAPSCRFFDPDVANAITGFGQQMLHWTRDAFEAEGVRVLYGDTDSVFVQLTGEADSLESEAETLRERVTRALAERVRRRYRLEPRLQLEYERLFERFWLPRVRGGGSGSKKRYAGWQGGRLVTVGLESVRRDWPAVARRLQEGLLERLFRDAPLAPFVRETVEQVLGGRLDAELVYVKRIRKGSLDRYTDTTPPHVEAARRAGRRVGSIVRYVITEGGPEPVEGRGPLPTGIDRRHYVERVLRPVAEAILAEVGESFDEALGRPRQLSLL